MQTLGVVFGRQSLEAFTSPTTAAKHKIGKPLLYVAGPLDDVGSTSRPGGQLLPSVLYEVHHGTTLAVKDQGHILFALNKLSEFVSGPKMRLIPLLEKNMRASIVLFAIDDILA